MPRRNPSLTRPALTHLRVPIDRRHGSAPQHVPHRNGPAVSGKRASMARVLAAQILQSRDRFAVAELFTDHGYGPVGQRVELVVALGDCGHQLRNGKQGLVSSRARGYQWAFKVLLYVFGRA